MLCCVLLCSAVIVSQRVTSGCRTISHGCVLLSWFLLCVSADYLGMLASDHIPSFLFPTLRKSKTRADFNLALHQRKKLCTGRLMILTNSKPMPKFQSKTGHSQRLNPYPSLQLRAHSPRDTTISPSTTQMN